LRSVPARRCWPSDRWRVATVRWWLARAGWVFPWRAQRGRIQSATSPRRKPNSARASTPLGKTAGAQAKPSTRELGQPYPLAKRA